MVSGIALKRSLVAVICALAALGIAGGGGKSSARSDTGSHSSAWPRPVDVAHLYHSQHSSKDAAPRSGRGAGGARLQWHPTPADGRRTAAYAGPAE